ncbi:MAG: hypothetical protein NVS3B6_21070 [Pseudarthrobacter sp.]
MGARATEAFDPRRSASRERVIGVLREHVEGPGADRFLSPELETADRLVASGGLIAAAESAVGILA